MRFVDLPSYGDPQVMKLAESDRPVPEAGEVLVKVTACGVNRPDIAQRRGIYPPPPGASPVMGLELSGKVVELGEGVDGKLLDQHVCALANGGAYAEYAVVPASQTMPIPSGLSMIEAAALPETFFTVWTNVFDRARLKAGESILIHGGSSGIGSTAIQLAKVFGAKVFTTAGSEEKCDFCREIGADLAINYRTQDFEKEILAATDSKGVDVVLDMVGGDYIQKNIQVAAIDGRVVSIAFLNGSKSELNLLPMMLKRLTITGSTLRPRSKEDKAAIADSLVKQVWPLIEAGKISPKIDAVFPIDQVIEAHTLMESSRHMGKIVLSFE
ncbi:NAD(P)H-quinone oxidoreductase [Aurantivibrio infirmus]